MVELEKLKSDIINRNVLLPLYVFDIKDCDTSFVYVEYIRRIAANKSLTIATYDNPALCRTSRSIFGGNPNFGKLRVLYVDELTDEFNLTSENDLIIVSKSYPTTYNNYVVKFSKLEKWQVKDYVYSRLDSVDKKKLDWLIDTYHYDIYRLKNECDKVALFESEKQNKLFNKFVSDNVFSGSSIYTVFTLTDAILSRDVKKVAEVLSEIDDIDAEPMGVVTILLNNFRTIIELQMNPSATAESVGISAKQYYVISKRLRFYSNNELVNIYEILTSVDKAIKSGEITDDILIDYLIIKILGRRLK